MAIACVELVASQSCHDWGAPGLSEVLSSAVHVEDVVQCVVEFAPEGLLLVDNADDIFLLVEVRITEAC